LRPYGKSAGRRFEPYRDHSFIIKEGSGPLLFFEVIFRQEKCLAYLYENAAMDTWDVYDYDSEGYGRKVGEEPTELVRIFITFAPHDVESMTEAIEAEMNRKGYILWDVWNMVLSNEGEAYCELIPLVRKNNENR
jgi:hypothetical protein